MRRKNYRRDLSNIHRTRSDNHRGACGIIGSFGIITRDIRFESYSLVVHFNYPEFKYKSYLVQGERSRELYFNESSKYYHLYKRLIKEITWDFPDSIKIR